MYYGGVLVYPNNETIGVTLNTNQSNTQDIQNSVITLEYEGVTLSQTWTGDYVYFDVPHDKQYTITFSEVEGYASPTTITRTAVGGGTTNHECTYSTTIVSVNLTTNQSSHTDLASTKVTITGDIKITNGSTYKVPTGSKITVTFDAVNGYATPAQIKDVTLNKTTYAINGVYNTTIVTVLMADNQSSYNDIANATATVTATGMTTVSSVKTGTTVKVPTGVSCKITWAALSGYKTPAAQTFTTSGTSMSKTGTYNTQILTVKVAGSGGTPSGYTVTVSGVGSQTTASKTYKVPYGNSYTISGNTITDWVPPTSVSYSANSASRTVTMTYCKVGLFSYTGAVQTRALPAGRYKLECWGAEGGYRSSQSYSGKGGYSYGTITLTATTNVYIYCGGSGRSGTVTSSIYTGGFNGGGYRHSYYGGGGASDIRIGTDSLYARVIVAGGGGSDGATNKKGMYGGGTVGGSSTESYTGASNYCGKGGNTTYSGYSSSYTNATQATTNGTSSTYYGGGFGFGGFGIYKSSGYGGAGGGGWYGGSGTYPDGSGDDDRGGGGGSGYVYTSSTASQYPSRCLLNSAHYLTDAATVAGNTSFTGPTGTSETGHSGNGYCKITYLGA